MRKYIQDSNGNKLEYKLNLDENPKGLPLLVILHGHSSDATSFKYKGWNVLAPHDNNGYKNEGCWWLGTNGDFYIKDLLQQLIKEVANIYDSTDKIYFYGSSMGGYGAILHGILCNAKAVYSNVPQIVLNGSTYFKHSMIKNIEEVFSKDTLNCSENNLISFMENNISKKLPIFFLCENMLMDEKQPRFKNYLQEHSLGFANKCIELQVPCHLELLPQSGHTKNYGLKEVVQKFEKYISPLTKQNSIKSQQIANIYYPPLSRIVFDDKVSYEFELDNSNLKVEYEIYSKYSFLELNYKNELILKLGNQVFIYANQNLDNFNEFKSENKIIQCFTLSNGNYLFSTQTEDKKHILLLIDKDLKIIKEQEVGYTSWHSQSSIVEANGIVMYSEYNVAKQPIKVSIYRSEDMGDTWEEVFFLNAPDEIRHWHTLQYDKYNNTWLATSGDASEKSRWFISKDDGENWKEITDRAFKEKVNVEKSLSAHRTTYVNIEKEQYIWATDDLMGNVKDYFFVKDNERKTSSKLYTSDKLTPLKIKKLTSLGIHIRSMVDIGNGYIFFSEGKYVTYNTQVFYVDKLNLNKAYFLFNIASSSAHGGTYSVNSNIKNNCFFIKHTTKKLSGCIKFNYDFKKLRNLSYNLNNYIRLEEHLWFLNKINSIQNIIFSDNKVKIELKHQKETFYMLLGDEKVESFQSKELFKVSKKQFGISIDVKSENSSSIKMYVQFFNDEKKVSSNSYILKNGNNLIGINIENEEEKYLRILFRIEHKQEDEIILSNLTLVDSVDISKTIPKTGSLQKNSLPLLDFRKETNLLKEKLIYNEYVQYNFLLDNFQIDILTHFKNSDKLVVFYNGAVDVDKTPPPVFQRWSWLKDMPYSTMVIMDPTIYNLMKENEATTYMGWYQGDKKNFILEKYIELIQSLANKLGVTPQNIVFYGSSVGGFTSLMSAGMLKGSKACVVNPQTNVLNYYKKNVDICLKYLNLTYDNLQNRKETLNVMEFYKNNNYFPQVYYKQNKQDTLHYEKHFKEFHTLYKENHKENNLYLNLLDDTRGHSAIPLYDEGYADIEATYKIFQNDIEAKKEKKQMTQIAKIYYPKKTLLRKDDKELRYIFNIDNMFLEVGAQGFTKYKFLYADEKQIIVRKTVGSFLISFDSGNTYKYEVKIKNFKIYQVYPLSNGYYLASGVTPEHKAYVYVFDENLKEMAKHQQGLMGWHAQDSIDEFNGVLMYVEYQNFEKGAPLPTELTVYRSYDYGMTWEKVFVKSHPDEVRHGHTLQVDKYTGEWLVTFGDTPTQSRWFISKDNGDNWNEITDKTYKMKEFPTRSQCAHRTTSIKIDKENYYWSTDDFMGNTKDYFTEFQGKRKTSAKIYKASKKQPLVLEEMSNIGIHGRCMIDIGKGYIILTEAKYASFNMQVYYVAKSNLSKVYFLFDVYGYRRHSGPASMCSEVMEGDYFYTAIARTMFLNSDYQTLKWNFKYFQNSEIQVEYTLQDYIRFEEHLWFLDKTTSLDDISFFGNGVKLVLNDKKDPFYLLLGDAKTDRLQSQELFKLDQKQKVGNLNVVLEKEQEISVKIYIQFFNDKEKISWKSFVLSNDMNQIIFDIENNFKYIKVLFRIENKLKTKSIVELKDLKFTYKNEMKENKQNKILNFDKNDSNPSLFFFQSNSSTFEIFNPREDTRAYKIIYPLDWSIDPFKDRNWCFQLHAWRMMDPLLLEYSKSKNIDLLQKCFIIMNDWKDYTFNQKKETNFTWYDMATGLRALKLTYFATIVFNTNLESQIDKKTKDNILFLLENHIEVLKNQNIALNNHGLFQLHGLIMASSLLEDKEGISYGLKKMDTLIESQFYHDGFHVENSDKYHGFVLDIFKRIIKFSEYQNDKQLIDIINKALYTWKLTVFPNLDPLLIGDTDYKIRKIEFDEDDNPNEYFIKFFKDSGYVFVRSTFSTKSNSASMLFFQTAYKNMTHRHSDDFNILLYEYGKNILVDAGQHSYDRNSQERDYVVSTRAHNTILIDSHNYDREEKLFYSSVLKNYEEQKGVFILQTLLQRNDIEVTHGRNIIYKPKEFLIVVDTLTSKKEREYSQYWHFHQDLKIVKDGSLFVSQIDNVNHMKVECSVFSFSGIMKKITQEKLDTQLYNGQTKPELQGWRSLKYRKLIKNYTLRSSISSKNVILITQFLFNDTKIDIEEITAKKIVINTSNEEKSILINL